VLNRIANPVYAQRFRPSARTWWPSLTDAPALARPECFLHLGGDVQPPCDTMRHAVASFPCRSVKRSWPLANEALGGIRNVLPCLSGQHIAYSVRDFCAFAQRPNNGRPMPVQASTGGLLNQFIIGHSGMLNNSCICHLDNAGAMILSRSCKNSALVGVVSRLLGGK
jgi:hypothetical protein